MIWLLAWGLIGMGFILAAIINLSIQSACIGILCLIVAWVGY